MGGDDLGDDFGYAIQPVRDSVESSLFEASLEAKGKKRPRSDVDEQEESAEQGNNNNKRKKPTGKLLIEAGRELRAQSAEVHTQFLWTALSHYTQLKGLSIDDERPFTSSLFVSSSETTLEKRIRACISMKKLKSWKSIGSPMVVILCLSARRAVAVLKELSSMKVRAAKLFAKHIQLEQQMDMISSNAYSVAVGTPHRVQALCQKGVGGRSPLHFGRTQLIVLDSETDSKGFTVCTLPDTAPATIDLIREQVLPQLKKRKDIKIAFF